MSGWLFAVASNFGCVGVVWARRGAPRRGDMGDHRRLDDIQHKLGAAPVVIIAVALGGERFSRCDVRLSMIVSTTNDVIGYRVVRHLGVVRGITVRSRSVVGNFFGSVQSVFGGKLSVYVNLAETARQEAFNHMCEHAAQEGANAVIAMRYDANEIMNGITEVLAYGTAVWVEPV